MEEVVIDEATNTVIIINYNCLTPEGEPIIIEMTLDEYNNINS